MDELVRRWAHGWTLCRGLAAPLDRSAALEVTLGLPGRAREVFALTDRAAAVDDLAIEITRPAPKESTRGRNAAGTSSGEAEGTRTEGTAAEGTTAVRTIAEGEGPSGRETATWLTVTTRQPARVAATLEQAGLKLRDKP